MFGKKQKFLPQQLISAVDSKLQIFLLGFSLFFLEELLVPSKYSNQSFLILLDFVLLLIYVHIAS
jgi:hypothetical protein